MGCVIDGISGIEGEGSEKTVYFAANLSRDETNSINYKTITFPFPVFPIATSAPHHIYPYFPDLSQKSVIHLPNLPTLFLFY